MAQVRRYYSKMHNERVKGVLSSFLEIHPLKEKDFGKLEELRKEKPMFVKNIEEVLKPQLNRDRENFGKYDILYAVRYVAYLKLSNVIKDAGGEERFQTEFTLPGDPRTPVRFIKNSGHKVAIADIRIMPDDELIRIDLPVLRLALPANAAYTANFPGEVGLFMTPNAGCSISELNGLLRHAGAAALFQEAAKYAEGAALRQAVENPAGVEGKRFEVRPGKLCIVRLDGPGIRFPHAFVLKRMEYPLEQLSRRFLELMDATHRIVKDSMQGHL